MVGGESGCNDKKVHIVKQFVPVPYYVPKPIYKYILRNHYVPIRQVVVKPVPVPYVVKQKYKEYKSHGSDYESTGYKANKYPITSQYNQGSSYDDGSVNEGASMYSQPPSDDYAPNDVANSAAGTSEADNGAYASGSVGDFYTGSSSNGKYASPAGNNAAGSSRGSYGTGYESSGHGPSSPAYDTASASSPMYSAAASTLSPVAMKPMAQSMPSNNNANGLSTASSETAYDYYGMPSNGLYSAAPYNPSTSRFSAPSSSYGSPYASSNSSFSSLYNSMYNPSTSYVPSYSAPVYSSPTSLYSAASPYNQMSSMGTASGFANYASYADQSSNALAASPSDEQPSTNESSDSSSSSGKKKDLFGTGSLEKARKLFSEHITKRITGKKSTSSSLESNPSASSDSASSSISR